MIRDGHTDLAILGGMETVSNAPYAVFKARFGASMGK